MIASQRTFGLLCATSFLVAGTFFKAQQAFSAEKQQRYASERVSIERAGPAKSHQEAPSRKRQSMVAQAATGRVLNDPPEAPLDGSLVKADVRQVGFFETHGTDCGPVCDCGSCGVDPVCGIEVGCGIGAMIGPGCGIEGCTDCCDQGVGIEEIYIDGPGCGIETGDCSCDACSDHGVCRVPLCLPLLRVNWFRFDFFAGVQGYKGPLNFVNANAANANIRSGSGSFGFYEGFNEGRSLRRWLGWDMAGQFGLRATQSNLSGANFTRDTRNQVFLTFGLFRKVDYGLQYGLVIDYLNDDWYFQGDSTQLRGELSWRQGGCHVGGFQFMAGVNDDTSTTVLDDGAGNVSVSSIAFEPTDQLRFFYRRLLNQGGSWDAFAGWTDNSDGLLGTNLNLPLRRHLSLSTGATFLIPREGDANGGNQQEGWNISLGLVYRPGGPTGAGRYSRPMFDVADNGTFLIDRK